MVKTYQYRIYPTKAQTQTLETQLDACRNIYNQALAWRKDTYEQKGESISYVQQANALTPLRGGSPFWSSLHSDVLQDTLRRLDKGFVAFFRRIKAGAGLSTIQGARSLSVYDLLASRKTARTRCEPTQRLPLQNGSPTLL